MSLSWRLKDLPTIEDVDKMIKSGIISKEEARSIFFKDSETTTPSDELKEIKEELALIRKLVTTPHNTVNWPIVIREYIEKTPSYPWRQPYITWASNAAQVQQGSQGIGVNLIS